MIEMIHTHNSVGLTPNMLGMHLQDALPKLLTLAIYQCYYVSYSL